MTSSRVGPAADWRDTPLTRVLSPMQAFIQSETAGGLTLIGATILALILANSPFSAAYNAVLETHIAVTVGRFSIDESVLHWINDGLMAIFFFVVGLELKREALVGELADRRQAMLPLIAALGGAVVPALIYTVINRGGAGAGGWGIPMATDIAFALGILALLGDRVPWALKVFLTAVAVIDDLLAVVVIALFYTSTINMVALGVGAGVLVLLALLNVAGIRVAALYGMLGLVVWLAFLESGVHATIAGVLVAFTIPARSRIDWTSFLDRARALLNACAPSAATGERMLTDERQQSAVRDLEELAEGVQTPLQRLEHGLHPWVAFGIVPIFALANAGVALAADGGGSGLPVALGVALGLVIGKPVGLFCATWLVVRLGVATLPTGVTWGQIIGVGCLAGLGFTMSLFIATLAFSDAALLQTAKLGILAASLVAGVVGYSIVRLTTTRPAAIPGAQR